MGVTFCAVAPEHPLATHAARTNPKLAAFIDECKHGRHHRSRLAPWKRRACPPAFVTTR
jgi:leucyl-tRNA synthetase